MDFRKAFKFLSGLKKNNSREWFQANQEDYQDLKKQFADYISELIRQVASFEPDVANLQPKDCIFRINRDIRFSHDKSPYKTNFGAGITEGGKKSPKAGYYFHLEPKGSFLAGGVWMPSSEVLKAIREEIDYNQEEFSKLLSSRNFKKYFKELEGEKLKTVPKGFSADHPMIEHLKLKSFVMVYNLSDEFLIGSKPAEITRIFEAMQPVNAFFNRTFD